MNQRKYQTALTPRVSACAQDPPAAGDYVFRDGLRFARPYYFDYVAHVKTRWRGRTVVDLFCAEFKGRTRDYYEQALAAGRLRVEETSMSARAGRQTTTAARADAQLQAKPTAPDARLRDGQVVRHYVHRHEPPARAARAVPHARA